MTFLLLGTWGQSCGSIGKKTQGNSGLQTFILRSYGQRPKNLQSFYCKVYAVI